MRFSLSATPIDITSIRPTLQRPDAGGFCSFEGWVRNHSHGKDVLRLEYEAYTALAVKEGEKILTELCEKYPVLDIKAIHRTGSLEPGELAVWIGVCSRHRKAAFEVCELAIGEIKKRVPIWKREFYSEKESVWVDNTCCAHP
ncbi:MAG: molybdenum cofactor biosynthesis protein MoaE [Chthoniobacterales bacterium]